MIWMRHILNLVPWHSSRLSQHKSLCIDHGIGIAIDDRLIRRMLEVSVRYCCYKISTKTGTDRDWVTE